MPPSRTVTTLLTTLLAALALGFVLSIFPSPLRAAAPPPAAYRIYFSNQTELQRLAEAVDIWTVDHAQGYVLAPLSNSDAAALQASYRIEPAPLPGPMPPAVTAGGVHIGVPGFACYRTVEETSATIAALHQSYPSLTEVRQIGSSWDKQTPGGPAGYDLEALVLTNRDLLGPKFRFFLIGAIHGRELATAETALRFAETLLAGYGGDADTTWLLDYGELHVLPIANPDGRKQAEAGILWRKNTNQADAACALPLPDYTSGVDLNRNSSFQWNSCFNCSSAVACSQTYRGLAPASEPETEAVEAYMRGIFDDVRAPDADAAAPPDTSGLFISLHSFGQYVLFPWGWSSLPTANATALQTLARKFGFYLGYNACQSGAGGCFYQTDGATDDFAYGDLGLPGYTFELGTWFFESCDYYESEIVDDALAGLRFAFKTAQSPYRSPAGPEVITMSPLSITVTAGSPFSITALADDTRSYGGSHGSDPAQPIQAARTTIDTPPWPASAIPIPIQPSGTGFDQAQEPLVVEIQTACWSAGRHLVYLQAQDRTGQWGPPSAMQVEITDGAEFTLDLASPSAIRAGVSATYTLTVTNMTSATDSFILSGEPATWAFELPIEPIGPLAPGAAAQVPLTITPPTQHFAQPDAARLVITSVANPDRCLHARLASPPPPRHWHLPFMRAQSPAP